MKTIEGYDVKIFTDNTEENALAQIKELLTIGVFSDKKIRIMPDIHAGAGCVIGFTGDLGDKVIPNIVGVDIGCGMRVFNLGKQVAISVALALILTLYVLPLNCVVMDFSSPVTVLIFTIYPCARSTLVTRFLSFVALIPTSTSAGFPANASFSVERNLEIRGYISTFITLPSTAFCNASCVTLSTGVTLIPSEILFFSSSRKVFMSLLSSFIFCSLPNILSSAFLTASVSLSVLAEIVA